MSKHVTGKSLWIEIDERIGSFYLVYRFRTFYSLVNNFYIIRKRPRFHIFFVLWKIYGNLFSYKNSMIRNRHIISLLPTKSYISLYLVVLWLSQGRTLYLLTYVKVRQTEDLLHGLSWIQMTYYWVAKTHKNLSLRRFVSHSVEISWFFYHSDFMWNQCWGF